MPEIEELTILADVLWVLKRELKKSTESLEYAENAVGDKTIHFALRSFYEGRALSLKIDNQVLERKIETIKKDFLREAL